MNFIAIIIIGVVALGGLYYFNEDMFHNLMSKTGQAIGDIKDKIEDKNITVADIHDKITYNTTEVDGKTYYGMPYSVAPCEIDSDCEWFDRDLKCDIENGECFK